MRKFVSHSITYVHIYLHFNSSCLTKPSCVPNPQQYNSKHQKSRGQMYDQKNSFLIHVATGFTLQALQFINVQQAPLECTMTCQYIKLLMTKGEYFPNYL